MNNSDEKDQLTRELQDRSRDIDGHPIDLESVKQGARKIARRRRIVSGAVAATVLAIAVPTALSVTNGSNGGADPVGPNPTPTDTQSAEPRPDGPVRLTTEGIPRGADPQVNYFRDPSGGDVGELVTPSGWRRLPVGLQDIAPYGDGWIGFGYDSRGEEMFFFDSAMQIIDRFSSGYGFSVSSDGSQVAYVKINDDKSQTLVSAPVDGAEPMTWSFPARPWLSTKGFMGLDSVLYSAGMDGVETFSLATADGRTKQLDGFLKITGANVANGLVAGQTRSNQDASGCFGVMDPASSTSEMLWETCDYSLSTFSPNGQFVLASDPYLDGIGAGSASILDAQTGELVVTYQQVGNSQIALTQTVWESNDTVLAIATDSLSFTILRMSTWGDLEAATEPFENDPNADVPYWFASPS